MDGEAPVQAAYANETSYYKFIKLDGLTGVGKTELLHRLRDSGRQVLDLEAHANHRGSTLGAAALPRQPSQKYFDSLVASTLSR